jgi:osmotically-inducible protein OsmY
MSSRTKAFLCASALAATLATSSSVMAQTASQWAQATVDTGKSAVRATEHAFHEVADDPILIEKTKSALSNDPITRNQPIIVSANKGTVILKGEVPARVASRAVQVAASINGAKGVDDEMAYAGKLRVKGVVDAPPPPYAATAPAEKVGAPPDLR